MLKHRWPLDRGPLGPNSCNLPCFVVARKPWGELLPCPFRELVWISFWLGIHSEDLRLYGSQESGQHGIHGIYIDLLTETSSGASLRGGWLGTPILPQLECLLEPAFEILRFDLIGRHLQVDALQCVGHDGWRCHEAGKPYTGGRKMGALGLGPNKLLLLLQVRWCSVVPSPLRCYVHWDRGFALWLQQASCPFHWRFRWGCHQQRHLAALIAMTNQRFQFD